MAYDAKKHTKALVYREDVDRVAEILARRKGHPSDASLASTIRAAFALLTEWDALLSSPLEQRLANLEKAVGLAPLPEDPRIAKAERLLAATRAFIAALNEEES